MDSDQKSIKPYLIIAIIAILIVAGLIWFFSRGTSKPTPKEEMPSAGGFPGGAPVGGGVGARGEEEKKEIGRFKRLTDFAVVSPALNRNGDKIIFYARGGGDIFESDLEGKKIDKISNVTIIGILEVGWSPQKNKTIVQYLDKNEVKKFIQTIGTTTQVSFLPPTSLSPAWSPDGSSLAYLLPSGRDYNLIIADSSGKNPKIRFSTPIPDFKINWITPDLIGLSSAPSGFAPSVVYTFNLRTESFSKVLSNTFGVSPLWSPDAKSILYSATSNKGENLSLFLKNNGAAPRLPIVTLVEKCVWAQDSKEVFCAVPINGLGSNLPDEYYQGLTSFTDKFVKINAADGNTAEIVNENGFDAENLLVTSDKKFLFFINRGDGTLWSLRL